ncbi:MAG: ThiF family adenylyltransferase, partial [Nitrosopumilus sp.]
MSNDEIFIRQIGIFNPDQYDQYGMTIVGCGAVGSVIGVTLAKIGLKKFVLYDGDKIERHNISNQFFASDEIGSYKSEALANNMKLLSPRKDLEIEAINKNLRKPFRLKTPIVFSCADTMKARKRTLENAQRDHVKLLIDTRMGGQAFEVFTVDLTNSKKVGEYKKTLFD